MSRTYLLTLESTDGSVVTPASNNFTVTDDELPGSPTLAINNVTLVEGNGAGNTTYTFTVTPSFVPTSNVVVNYAIADGTAALADNDFVATSGTLTILAGSPSETFTVTVPHDAKFETNETFSAVLSGGSGYTALGSTLTGTGTITNDDTAPTISIDSPTIAEGSGAGMTTLNYTVTLAQASGVSTTVNFATSDGTATLADSDYITASSTLTIPAGSTSGTISVNVLRDAKFEANETIVVTLSGGTNYTSAGSIFIGTGTVTNDDTSPTISVANISQAEGNGAGTSTFAFTVSLSSASGQAVTVDYATSDATATTADSDYTSASGTLTIPAGSTSGTINVSITRDAKNESNETFNLTLSNGSGYTLLGSTLSAVGTITNDDSAPTISIANVSSAEGTGATTTTQTFTITASAASGVAITVNYATSDGTATIANSDYASSSGTATISAGTTTTTISVNINHDALNEPNETYTMTLSGGSGYTSAGSTLTATGTISNDDTAPTVQWSVASQSINENGTSVTLTAQLSAVSGQTVSVPFTVSGTATGGGTDYTISASPLSIAAGATTATATVTVVNDTTPETNETVIATIGTPTNATVGTNSAHTVTINDDDINAFTITGVQSATLDTISDAYLNFQSAPKFIYAAATGAATYDVTVYENDGTTITCALQNTALTTFSPSSCTLVPGTNYKVKVTAKNANGFTRDATNSLYGFYYNRAPVISATRGNWYFAPDSPRTMNIIADDPATVANDPATDADGDTISVLSVTNPGDGFTTLSAPQSVTYRSVAEYDGSDSFVVTITDGKGGNVNTTVNVTVVSPFRWIGGGGVVNTNWNHGPNWCGAVDVSTGSCPAGGGAAPGATNTAWFGSWCATCNATINLPITVGGLQSTTGYTGTITQNVGQDISVGANTNGFYLRNGFFVGASDVNTHFTALGDFRVMAAASFTAPSGNLSFASVGNAVRGYNIGTGSFHHNNGTVRFDSNLSAVNGTYQLGNIAVNGSITFHKLVLNMQNTNVGASSYSVVFANFVNPADIVYVETDFEVISGAFANGTINLSGNLTYSCSTKNLCGHLSTTTGPYRVNFVGANDATYTIDSTYMVPTLPIFGIAKDDNTVTVSSSNTSASLAALEISQGEFIAPTGVLTVGKRWVSSSVGNKTVGFSNTGGVFTHSNGTVKWFADTNTTTSYYNFLYVNTPTPTYLYNLIIDLQRETSGDGLVSAWINAGSQLYVENTITHLSGILEGSGSISLLGPSYTASCGSATHCVWNPYISSGITSIAYISFEGSAPQTYTVTSGVKAPRFKIKKSALANTVTPTAGSLLNTVGIHIEQGTLHLPALTTVGASATSTAGFSAGIFMLAGAGNGQIVHNNGTVVLQTFHQTSTNVVSMADISLNGRTLNLYNLTLDFQASALVASPHVSTFLGDLLVVENDLVVESGNFRQSAGSQLAPNMEIYGDVYFNCSSATKCASYGHVYSINAALRGANKTIYQAPGAQNIFKYMTVDLTDNSQILTLQSDLSGINLLDGLPYGNVILKKGNINLAGFTFTGIDNLSINAGTACSAPLSYVSASGAIGSGCGP